MAKDIPAVRILPMSDKVPGFSGLSVEQVQARFFLGRFVKARGRFGYRSSGLNALAGTVVLFQFKARVIASAVFLRDEPKEGEGERGGALWFEVGSIRTFEPVDVEGMRRAWQSFRGFGHVKQFLNPAGYGRFARALREERRPEQSVAPLRRSN